MVNDTERSDVQIRRTAHGKPYHDRIQVVEHDIQESPLHDALDFPCADGLDEIESGLRAKSPGIAVGPGEPNRKVILGLRSLNRRIERDEFMRTWHIQLGLTKLFGFEGLNDPFFRNVPVRLSGKDRVRWWSGWFHYPLLIENSSGEMRESGERLQSLFGEREPTARDVIEEAYFEQVMRERLAIFERRREWWRVIRWGSTTALGIVLAAWSLMQIVDRVIGG